MNHAIPVKATLLASLAALARAPAASRAQLLDLAQSPPAAVEPYVAPNVILSLDNSGSTQWWPAHGLRHRGFTLIELMMVVTIVAILGAIALPSYSEYIRRGHRADARTGLLQAQLWLERAATAKGVYPRSLPDALTWQGDASKRYTISLQSGTETAFTLIAMRRSGSGQESDKCGDFTLTHTGVRGVSSASLSAAECWSR